MSEDTPAPPATISTTISAEPVTTCKALVVAPKDTLAELTEANARAQTALVNAKKADSDVGEVGVAMTLCGVLFGGGATTICALAAPVVATVLVGAGTLAVAGGGIYLLVSSAKRLGKAGVTAALAENAMKTEKLRITDETQRLVAERTAKLQNGIGAALDALFPDDNIQVGARTSFPDPDRPGHDLHLRVTRVTEDEGDVAIKRKVTIRLYEVVLKGRETSVQELDVVSPMTISRDRLLPQGADHKLSLLRFPALSTSTGPARPIRPPVDQPPRQG